MWIFYEVLWYLEQIYDPNKGKQKDTKEFCQSILKGKANGLGSPQVSTPSTPLLDPPWNQPESFWSQHLQPPLQRPGSNKGLSSPHLRSLLESVNRSVVSSSLRVTPWTVVHQAARPQKSPGKNTRVDCHSLHQRIFLTQGLNPGLLHCRQML